MIFKNLNEFGDVIEYCREYRDITNQGLLAQTEPAGRGLYQKTEVQYFSVKTKKSLLCGMRHFIYLKNRGHAKTKVILNTIIQ